MNQAPAETLLARAGALIEARLGLNFPPARWNDLEQGLARAAAEFGMADGAALMEWLLHDRLSRRDIELLASQLTIGETYFFRERAAFDALESRFFPALIRRRREDRRLRVWCAGCCTGEEPYSLAMLLERMLPDIDDWNVLILATDINPQFLRRAAAGLYKEWSFRESGPAIKERFFQRSAERQHEVLPRVRRRVTFEYLNLAEDAYPSLLNNTNAMDLILCRNVLMYFSAPRMKEVVGRLRRCLAPGGCLVVSATETSQQLFAQFHAEHVGDAVLYYGRENGAGSSRTASPGADHHQDATEPEPAPPLALRPRPADAARASNGDRADQRRPAAVRETEDVARALELYRRGGYDEAEAMAQRLMRRDASAELFLLRARIAANQGRLPAALEWCDRALAADRLDPRACYLRAVILQELDRPLDAVTALHQALYLDPGFVLAHVALGHLALRQQRHIQARKHFINALELLRGLPPEEELPESDGLTAGRLAEVVASMNGLP